MNLQELKEKVDAAWERAVSDGDKPKYIKVSLRIDGMQYDTPDYESVLSGENVELHYDGNPCAGCILKADTFMMATEKALMGSRWKMK